MSLHEVMLRGRYQLNMQLVDLMTMPNIYYAFYDSIQTTLCTIPFINVRPGRSINGSRTRQRLSNKAAQLIVVTQRGPQCCRRMWSVSLCKMRIKSNRFPPLSDTHIYRLMKLYKTLHTQNTTYIYTHSLKAITKTTEMATALTTSARYTPSIMTTVAKIYSEIAAASEMEHIKLEDLTGLLRTMNEDPNAKDGKNAKEKFEMTERYELTSSLSIYAIKPPISMLNFIRSSLTPV